MLRTELPLTENKLKFGGIHGIGSRAENKKIMINRDISLSKCYSCIYNSLQGRVKEKIIEHNEKKASSSY